MVNRLLIYLWVAPVTLFALPLVLLTRGSGGSVHLRNGAIEAAGGLLKTLFSRRIPFVGYGAAMTLGYVILAQDANCLNQSRTHEWAHIRQYERWGAFLLPAYFMTSLWLWLRGRQPYMENPFEREAYRSERETDEFSG